MYIQGSSRYIRASTQMDVEASISFHRIHAHALVTRHTCIFFSNQIFTYFFFTFKHSGHPSPSKIKTSLQMCVSWWVILWLCWCISDQLYLHATSCLFCTKMWEVTDHLPSQHYSSFTAGPWVWDPHWPSRTTTSSAAVMQRLFPKFEAALPFSTQSPALVGHLTPSI